MCGLKVNLLYWRHLGSGLVLATKQEGNLFSKYYGVKCVGNMGKSHLATSQINQAELHNFIRDNYDSYMYIQLTLTKPCPVSMFYQGKEL